MILTKRICLKPNKTQLRQLYKSANINRFVYNWTLGRQKENYENGGKFISDNDLRKEITQLKKDELSFLKEVSNNVAKQSVKDACIAYKRFFKKQSSFPKFKAKKRTIPSFYNDNVKLKVKEKKVLIEKVGWVKTTEQVPEGKCYNPRVKFDGKYWYLTIGIDVEKQKIKHTEEIIGIDLGIKDLAICSNGVTYGNINKPQRIKKLKKSLKQKQRRVSRKYIKNMEGRRYIKTKNILKLEQKIKVLYRKMYGIRNNYLHQVTTEIVKTKPSQINIEDLNIKGMMKNKNLSKAIQEQSLYNFGLLLKYKSELNGIKFVKIDRWFPSSKTCSKCGAIKSNLKLSDRTFKCKCGFTCDRDLNASYNIRDY